MQRFWVIGILLVLAVAVYFVVNSLQSSPKSIICSSLSSVMCNPATGEQVNAKPKGCTFEVYPAIEDLEAQGWTNCFGKAVAVPSCQDCQNMCNPTTGEKVCGSNCVQNFNYVKKLAEQGLVSCYLLESGSGPQCDDCAQMCNSTTGERTCGSSCAGNVNNVEKLKALGWEYCPT